MAAPERAARTAAADELCRAAYDACDGPEVGVALVTSGKGKMPAYADKLKDEEIRAIATYVKSMAK